MLKDLSLVKKKIDAWIKKNGVIDVVLFGSSARGKTSPNDLDMCIIINKYREDESIDLADSLRNIKSIKDFNPQVNVLTAESFAKGDTLSRVIITEGYSIRNKKAFASILGMQNMSIFIYSMKDFSSSKRVQFHYMLKGRYGSEGILNEIKGEMIGKGVISVPTENEDLFREILEKWDVKYEIKRTLVS